MNATNPESSMDACLLRPGNTNCGGCGMSTGLTMLGRALENESYSMVIPACCGIVTAGAFPTTSYNVPVVASTFASSPAFASGVAAVNELNQEPDEKPRHVICWAGDGGTYDIGIATLSAAAERDENLIYICYDNEAYMNTGVQRSSTTPKGVLTNNTPSGKVEQKKDVPAIIAAHKPAYVASCSASYPLDFHDKLLKAKQIKGFKYFHIHTPCPPGWGVEERMAIAVGKAAVDSGLYDLYEIEQGEFRLTGPSEKLLRKKKMPPIGDYFSLQARFRKLQPDYLEALQHEVDVKWAGYREAFL